MSSYFQSIQIGILLFFGFAFLALIPYMIFQYRKRGGVSAWRFLVTFSFALYLICAYALTIFPLPDPAVVAKFTAPKQNLVPFMFVREFLKVSPFQLVHPNTWLAALKDASFIQPAFNVLLTLPFGFYLRYLFKRRFSFTLITSFLLTLSFESIQRSALFGLYPRPYRLFDVDDLMLNTLGALIGFALAAVIANMLPDLDKESSKRGQISFTRRVIAFMLNALPFGFLSVLVNSYLGWPLFFILIPLIFKKTLGQMLLKIEIIPEKRRRILFRQILAGINFLPLLVLLILLGRSASIPETELSENYLLVLLTLGLGFLPILDFLIARLNGSRLLWYERLSQTSLKEKIRKEK